MSESTTITKTTNESDSVTLKKTAKGVYNWEIKVYGDKEEEILKKIASIDKSLNESFKFNEV